MEFKDFTDFEYYVVEILIEIKRRLIRYGKNDTDQTIKIICEGIDRFMKHHKLGGENGLPNLQT